MIFDLGASLAILFVKEHFLGHIRPLVNCQLGGLANGLDIKGIGTVKWKLRAKGKVLTILSWCYYVPGAHARLISPQRLFNRQQGVTGHFMVTESGASLVLDKLRELPIEHDDNNLLPTAFAKNASQSGEGAYLAGVLDAENENLTIPQKLLIY